jgi:hypothetical protein
LTSSTTPTALLRDAPPAPPFRREDVLQPTVIDTIVKSHQTGPCRRPR